MSILGKLKNTSAKADKTPKQKVFNIPFDEYFDDIKKFVDLDAEVKSKKSIVDNIKDSLKTVAGRLWVDEYLKNKSNPKSIILECRDKFGNFGSFMFLGMDKYKKVSEPVALELKERYGDDIVEEKTIYSFNNEMLEKYYDSIENFLANSPDIADEDREKMLICETEFNVKKGAIDKLFLLHEQSNSDIGAILSDIQPEFQIKSQKYEVVNEVVKEETYVSNEIIDDEDFLNI